MENVNEVIKQLAAAYDKWTEERRKYIEKPNPLVLFGDENSIFLKQVAKKAAKFDYPVVFNDLDLICNDGCRGFIIDQETYNSRKVHNALVGTNGDWARAVDIDHTFYPESDGMPAVATAVWRLIHEICGDGCNGISGKDITIVGRGSATNGLIGKLIEDNATVTVAHSHTNDMAFATMDRDVVVYATPQLTGEISYDTHDLVIDLGNAVSDPELFECPYTNRIGGLTTSILLYRMM